MSDQEDKRMADLLASLPSDVEMAAAEIFCRIRYDPSPSGLSPLHTSIVAKKILQSFLKIFIRNQESGFSSRSSTRISSPLVQSSIEISVCLRFFILSNQVTHHLSCNIKLLQSISKGRSLFI